MYKLFIIATICLSSSAQAIQYLPPTTHGRLTEEAGRAFGQGFSQGIDQELQYQRQLRYQRDMMELLREQIRWEMENAR
ncbi:MAG: hypothetical protein LLG04_01280 [Parachlamydia sp.]|nr:hypothetical protein [Parachlamydia sp.]